MYPWLLPEVFGKIVSTYDLMIVFGSFVLLLYVIQRLEKKEGFTREQSSQVGLYLVISLLVAFFSALIFDGLFHTLKNGVFTFGSITFLGGFIGGMSTFVLLYYRFYKHENKDLKRILNIVIPGVVLGHAIGRIGCFLAGSCFGIPTESILGVHFSSGMATVMYPDLAVFPTQLFESFFLFILFFILTNYKNLRNRELEMYLISYGIWRFFLEFIRGDDRGSFLGLIHTQYNVYPSPSQFLSILMILLGILIIRKMKFRQTLQQ